MRRVGVLSLLCMLLCVGCMAPHSAEMASVDARGWNEPARIVVENDDTLTLRKLSIALRYNSSFNESQLPLSIRVTAPDGRIFEEKQCFPLNGERSTLVSEVVSLPYRDEVQLAMRGAYTFEFQPEAELKGVEAIGIEIEK